MDDSSGQEIKHHNGNIGTMDDASGQEIKHHTDYISPYRSMAECEKNPGHTNFIPIGELGLQHLPLELQSQDMLEFIQCTANLTVRFGVALLDTIFTSDIRSAAFLPTEASACYRGLPSRKGTGFITWVEQLREGQCPYKNCFDCLQGLTSWIFKICTAQHVLCDSTDTVNSDRAVVDLHYDDHESRPADASPWEIVSRIDEATDTSIVSFVTHDIELATRVKEQVELWNRLYGRLVMKNIQTNAVFLVSHPHGQWKLVSVGEKKCESTVLVGGENVGYLFSYTASTCPGSSGAIVLSLGDMLKSAFQKGVWWCMGNHSKRGDVEGWNDGYGFHPREGTSTCEAQVTRQVQRLENNPTHRECWKAWGECPYKESHKHFTPIKEFNLEGLRRIFYRYIKAVAGLTVRLRVQNVDGEQATATGFISDIRRINLNISWRLSIITARHNVYVDGKKPKRKWIDLFFDSEEDRLENRMKTINMATEHFCRKDTDWISLNCDTEDAVLAEEVARLQKWRYKLWDVCKDSEATTDTVVIISHPHGLSKMVSVGKLEEWKQICEFTVGCQYRATTCFGSSGAPVISPRDPWGGKTWGVWMHHCGACDDDGLNEGYC